MKKLFYLLLLCPFLMLSQENESFLLNMSEITVKSGHNSQFMEGVKAYKKCYNDNEGKDKWNMWRRMQGEGTVYTFTSTMAKWAEMDDNNDPADKECRLKVVDLIMPHVKKVHYNIARSVPSVSRSAMPEDTQVVWVYNVKTKNSTSFKEVVDEISKAVKKAEGESRGIWYSVVGGSPEVADYFVGVPYKNFAAMDDERDGVWKIYEKANGKSKTKELRAKFRDAVSSDWSYIYTLNKELSN